MALPFIAFFAVFARTSLSLRSLDGLVGETAVQTKGVPVFVNVYDLDDSATIAVVNTLLFAGGAYHAGVQYGAPGQFGTEEWAYGMKDYCCETGISQQAIPGVHPVHKFYDRVLLGYTNINTNQFHALVQRLIDNGEWRGYDYDLLTHNCISFSKALLASFPEQFEVPYWLERLMNIGASVLPKLGSIFGASSASIDVVSESGAGMTQLVHQQTHKVTGLLVCATQFNNACGSFHLEGQWYSVACPHGFSCHSFQQRPQAMCVPTAQFGLGPQAHMFDNNANGACGR